MTAATDRPNQILNVPNAITVARIILSPLMFWLVPASGKGSWVAIIAWFLLCVSDWVDGYLARKQGTTSTGAFLDPLADKVLVLGALATLAIHGYFSWIPVILIAAREVLISVYRSLVATKGVSIPASQMGKWKTVVQQFAVASAITPFFADRASWVAIALLWLAVVLTLVSGAQYMWYAVKGAAAQNEQ